MPADAPAPPGSQVKKDPDGSVWIAVDDGGYVQVGSEIEPLSTDVYVGDSDAVRVTTDGSIVRLRMCPSAAAPVILDAVIEKCRIMMERHGLWPRKEAPPLPLPLNNKIDDVDDGKTEFPEAPEVPEKGTVSKRTSARAWPSGIIKENDTRTGGR